MFKHTGIVLGLIGGVIIVVSGILLALQSQISLVLIGAAALFPLLVICIVALAAGRQAHLKEQNVTVEGTIVGVLITLGLLISNVIITTSPAYETAINNLPAEGESLQITGFELSPGSVVVSLLINVLIATAHVFWFAAVWIKSPRTWTRLFRIEAPFQCLIQRSAFSSLMITPPFGLRYGR